MLAGDQYIINTYVDERFAVDAPDPYGCARASLPGAVATPQTTPMAATYAISRSLVKLTAATISRTRLNLVR